jgi:peptide-methionine (S)-S-oxide reductase
MERMVVGGGCFWCVEGAYKQIHGVESALPAYAGGHVVNPSYEAVCTGTTGHAEVVEVQYDPSIISFETLLEVFFTVHDPTQLNRQGNDIGTQYRSCIMPLSEDQRLVAENTIAAMGEVYDEPIVTTLEEPVNFVIAEEKHHDYYARNPYQGYCAAVVGPKIARVAGPSKTMGEVQESPFTSPGHGQQRRDTPQAQQRTHPRVRTRKS